jgi:hypothetical protein
VKKTYLILAVIVIIAASAMIFYHTQAGSNGKYDSCTTIQSGELMTTDGELLTTGYSEWGYNYQGRVFNGDYCDYYPYYRPGGAGYEWCQENYGNVKLVMKWNDAWLSNKDFDGDGLLDRYYGYPSYIGSGSWTTNHMTGSYEQDGKTCKWDYFVKIVAAPADTYEESGIWYTSNGVEIGSVIWGSFATIQEVSNDPCAGEHGVQYLSPVGPGFGKF